MSNFGSDMVMYTFNPGRGRGTEGQRGRQAEAEAEAGESLADVVQWHSTHLV